MNNFAISSTRRWLLLALAVLTFLPLTASAQDWPDRTERLKQALDLTDAQVQLVEQAVGDEAERGDLWRVAAALTPTLTDAQKEKLFARPERGDKMQSRRGERGDRTPRERPDAEDRAAQHEAMQEDMQEALGLSDAQAQQLEALHAQKQAERQAQREQRQAERERRRAERPAPGELPAEVAAILTPAQQEVAKVHRALAVHMVHGRAHRGPRR